MKKLILALVLLVAACSPPGKDELATMVKDRASFDLGCPKDKLNITTISEPKIVWLTQKTGSMGVSGCGLKRAYIVDVNGNIFNDSSVQPELIK